MTERMRRMKYTRANQYTTIHIPTAANSARSVYKFDRAAPTYKFDLAPSYHPLCRFPIISILIPTPLELCAECSYR